jgi:maltose alpha-D-glucosyltransferase/alpha-amylase
MTASWRLPADELANFLKQRRWFGGKGRVIRSAAVDDAFPVRWPQSQHTFAVARIRVVTDDGESQYQIFLGPDEGRVEDALSDEEFRRGLVNAFARGVSIDAATGTARWVVASETETPLVVPPHAKVSLVSTEQTNSSVIIEGEAILKLYRKLEPGLNPDVEVTRFLTIERAFPHVPVLLGSIRFEDEDSVTTAGMLQELVPGAVDAWTYTLGRAREFLGADEPAEATAFAQEARQLGVVTREMHEALASGAPGSDFDLRSASLDDVTTWCQAARRTISGALQALERALRDTRVAQSYEATARALLDRRAEFLQLPTSIAAHIGADAGARTRTHGDYHLGQVLRSATDRFLIIDFEGEPARPLAERRERQSPLRDVAGMLRSFAYAAAATGKDDPRVDEWERVMRAQFLTGYFEVTGPNAVLPRTQANVRHLLKLFEAEKVFYELQYELDHRPDWLWIPMHGINALGTPGALT